MQPSDEPPAPATPEQLHLLHAAAPRVVAERVRAEPDEPAVPQPVARVVLDVSLAHLDRPFEYAVPADLAQSARPGVRVKVRFAGKDVSGFVVDRVDEPEHTGKLTPLRRVVSPEPVLTASVLAAARTIADHYAGPLADVLRLAVPPRHAAAEKALDAKPVTEPARPGGEDSTAWQRYPAGDAFLRRLAAGDDPAASWLAAPTVDPDQDWPAALAHAARATLHGGRGAVLVVPDHRDLDRLEAAVIAALGEGRHVRLTAEQGPQARYTAWLKALRGHVRCVIGTRAAAWAPVRDLGLLACWDDGDDLLAEPRSPYPQTREVLRVRAGRERAALLLGGFARSVPVQRWLATGTVRDVSARTAPGSVPRVVVAGDEREVERAGAAAHAHLPPVAWSTAHAALADGPVLVQVPRRGYLPTLRCGQCRQIARCGACHGPLGLTAPTAPASCRWCGRQASPWRCPECYGTALRAAVVGARRTAEELGRAFPGTTVLRSGAGEVLGHVGPEPKLVIATPGAEPVAETGYAATLLLDAWALLDRSALDAGEETLRRWLAAAALTRPAARGGAVVVCGAASGVTLPPVEALARWAPATFAERELAARRELDLPPASWMALVTGDAADLGAFADAARHALDDSIPLERIGPMPAPGGGEGTALLLRTALPHAPAASRAVAAARAVRSARKLPGTVTVRVDPSGALL
ncbi:primosome assembly protein PriA [Flexivirga oryzae]|uniref:Probable replication restart protein PriA n=1 Tax=Flexivirga oryzae TaxID=1794944 RepID=A0A839N0R0_9MICO|nr:primosome assembly protein PriA [Flexivirga oryzae]MBB2891310.1 primosomal protein N' (replication factor Y) [Flexivirga oryzae]